MAASKEIGWGVVGMGMGRQVLNINKDTDSKQRVVGICDIDRDRRGFGKAQERVARQRRRENSGRSAEVLRQSLGLKPDLHIRQ